MTPGVATSFGESSAIREHGGARDAGSDLEIGSEVAGLAGHERVLAGARGREEVQRLLPAHHPGLGLHGRVFEPDALEHAVVRLLVLAVGDVEPRLVAIERVPVLHDELAQPQEPPARARLVPLLDGEVVEQLGELAVARDLPRVERHRLLVGQRQHVVASVPVLQAKDLRDRVAARLLPQLVGRQHRHEHLLAADRVHLLANDLHDLLVYPPAEREERPHASGYLTDVPAAYEQLVRDGVGIGRRLAQGRDEEL